MKTKPQFRNSIMGLALLSLAISCNNDDTGDMMSTATAPDVNFTALASNNTILQC
jgi:hypothetical protein